MNSLIPWCPIKARNGSYEVVTREGHPVTEWHMFENIDPYPLRAVVEYPTGSKIVEFSRTGGYLDGDDEIAEDENDLMLKPRQPVERVNGYFVKAGVSADDAEIHEALYIADPMSSSWCYRVHFGAASKDERAMAFNRGLVYATRADAAAKAMAMTGLDPQAAAGGV